MNCWNCDKAVDHPLPLPFRALCDHCSSWQHVCKNCRFYAPGKPNSCELPELELISDKQHMNFCDEFSIRLNKNILQNPSRDDLLKQASERLFGDSDDIPKSTTNFDDLFKPGL